MEQLDKNTKVRVAVVGCLHGQLKDLYKDIMALEKRDNKKIDIVLCCGDFQSLRNESDLKYISCPDKYKHMGQFHHYFLDEEAPYLTIFIGGNHEASNVLEENYYGGWITKNIFYLGKAGVIQFKGLRIAGVSGIFKDFDYYKGHHEKNVLKNLKSVYHYREFEILKMSLLQQNKLDFILSHDWPTGVIDKKDIKKIISVKKHWKEEIESNVLGGPAYKYLLKELKPKYWCSAHMHYYYKNDIKHKEGNVTTFLALDKPIQNRTYLYILDVDSNGTQEEIESNQIYFDSEWLAVTKTLNEYMPLENKNYDFSSFFPNKEYKNLMMTYYNKYFSYSYAVNKISPEKDFFEILNKNKEIFNNDKTEWKYMVNPDQKEFIVNLLGINNYYDIKDKEMFTNLKNDIGNSEEIDVDIDFY